MVFYPLLALPNICDKSCQIFGSYATSLMQTVVCWTPGQMLLDSGEQDRLEHMNLALASQKPQNSVEGSVERTLKHVREANEGAWEEVTPNARTGTTPLIE
jgi:hypothetical protein